MKKNQVDAMKASIADILLDLGAVNGAVVADESGNVTETLISAEDMKAAEERAKKKFSKK